MTALAVEPMVLPCEAADVLRMDERSVRRACAKREIPGTKIGKGWRIPAAWLATVASWSPEGTDAP